MKITIPLHILAYIKTTSKCYDTIGYRIQQAIADAVYHEYTDYVFVYDDAGVCLGVFGGENAGKHLPKRSTKENCRRYGIEYKDTVFCDTCACIQRVALCHKIPRCCFGSLHADNLYIGCGVCNSHTADTLDEDIAVALSQFTITIDV